MNADSQKDSSQIVWPPLIKGVLLKRYKRFMADIVLADGETVTAHCANSGRMIACSQPGRPVYLSTHDNPRRKLKYTWEMIEMPESLVGVNTMIPNKLVAAAIQSGNVPELNGYDSVRREVKAGKKSRLDIYLAGENGKDCFVEVKNCTLVTNGLAQFPDAVTARGRKHLLEMEQLVSEGFRCVMFYLIQRMDASAFSPADHIDPEYGKAVRMVAAKGVELLAYDVIIDLSGLRLGRRIPVLL